MLPACEVWHVPCHSDCKAKGGKEGSLHEDLGQDKQKLEILQIAFYGISNNTESSATAEM